MEAGSATPISNPHIVHLESPLTAHPGHPKERPQGHSGVYKEEAAQEPKGYAWKGCIRGSPPGCGPRYSEEEEGAPQRTEPGGWFPSDCNSLCGGCRQALEGGARRASWAWAVLPESPNTRQVHCLETRGSESSQPC